jgi:hypothetical protein
MKIKSISALGDEEQRLKAAEESSEHNKSLNKVSNSKMRTKVKKANFGASTYQSIKSG